MLVAVALLAGENSVRISAQVPNSLGEMEMEDRGRGKVDVPG